MRPGPTLYGLVMAGLLWASPALAQPDRTHQASYWLGLMTDWALSGPWSLWFDTHYNDATFVVLRSGITYRFEPGPTVTCGYAHLWTDPGNDSLSRNEHRPWAQAFLPFTFSDRWSVTQRLRFDLRVREAVAEGMPENGWQVVPRVRSQTAVSYWLAPTAIGRFFLQTAGELLVNGGRNAGPNFLDQSRLSLMLGYRPGPVTVRVGYLDRFVPGTTGQAPVHEHNAVLWVNYRFKPTAAGRIVPPEGKNP